VSPVGYHSAAGLDATGDQSSFSSEIQQYTLQVVDHVNSNYVAWGGDIRFSDTFQVCETVLTMLPAASSMCLSVHEKCPGDR